MVNARARWTRWGLAVATASVAACLYPYDGTLVLAASRSCPDTSAAAVTWVFPVVDGDNRQLEDWCVTVGPAVVESIPHGAFGPLVAGDSLAVAAWNVDAGAGNLMGFLTDEFGLDCSGAQSRSTRGGMHFVLLLQEALRRSNEIPDLPPQWVIPPPVLEDPHGGPRLDVVEVAERCGLALFYLSGARNGHAARDGKREDKGEAILSTLPLSDLIGIELPYEAARRVVVAATVRNELGDSLRLASVHLISMTPLWRIMQTGNSSRQRQALAIVEGLRVVEGQDTGAPGSPPPPSISTIVAGDLNTWSTREAALRHLLRAFPDSPPLLKVPTRGPFPTDHLLFRRGTGSPTSGILATSYRRVDDTYHSDHNPIIAWFTITAADRS